MQKLSMSLKEIPKNARIALYGIGKRGQDYQKIISACRPDITIICFIDSFKNNIESTPPVLQVSSIDPLQFDVNVILICSEFHIEIVMRLRECGLFPHDYISTFKTDWFTHILPGEESTICESMYKDLLGKLPRESFVYDALGHIKIQKNDFESALQFFKQGKEKFPDDIWNYLGQANALRETNRFEEAEDIFKLVVKKFPHNPNGHLGYALLLRETNRFEKAENILKSIVLEFPDNPYGYIGLAETLMHEGNFAEAERLLLSAEKIFDNNIEILCNLKTVCILQGKYFEAKEVLSRTVSCMPYKCPENTCGQKKILFDHILKCGGTTVCNYLLLNYSNCLSLNMDIFNGHYGNIVDYFSMLTDKEKNNYFLIYSHNADLLIPYLQPDVIKTTILRHPVDRAISFYFYLLSGSQGKPFCSLYEFIQNLPSIYIDKYSTKNEREELSDKFLVESCFSKLNKQYDLVGLTEKMVPFLSELHDIAGLNIAYSGNRRNVTYKRKLIRDIDNKTIDFAMERFDLDIQLYNLVKSKWDEKAATA